VAYQDWRARRAGEAVARSMSSSRNKAREKVKVKA